MNNTPFLSECPAEPGFYHLKCEESDKEIELVFITLDGFDLAVYSDGLWQDLDVFHYNLTNPQWRKVDSRNFNT